jgi:murein DD-endopeptidase MepM/ murein hydrolase activator NlpD
MLLMLRMRHVSVLAALALAAGAALPAAPAGGAGEIDDLEAKVAAAKEAADAAAARYEEAWSAWAAIDNDITALEEDIGNAEIASAQLQIAAERRAVDAYMGHDVGLTSYLGDGDVLDVARRAALLDQITAADNAAVDELGEVREDLTAKRDELTGKEEEAEAALDEMQAEEARLTAELEANQAALAEAEEAQRRAEAEARRQQEEQQRQQQPSAPAPAPGGRASSSQAPVGGIVCPVPASSFVDSWGAPRGGGLYHWGIDMMAPAGSPNYAVVSGDMEQRSGSTSGNGVYLYGDNGTLYYYFHLQGYAGGPRHVSQGEVVGYTGNTGASWAAPHTHFEIHPGGGEGVNPYPALKAACG